ncbi:MAG: methyltransferase [Candidatus Peribacteria bacterium]|nr:methyltransferase [Candidatus Peribacteria bacterium]
MPFYVNEATIIPRPETEYMITAVGERLKQQKKSDFSLLLDIGTGSGVLGISLLLQHPDTFREVYLTDISPAALEVAKKNYATLITQPQQYETHFLQSDLAAFMSTEAFEHQRKKAVQTNGHIVLVANLPYIPDETFDTNALEQMQKREPRLAFVGGNDGLALYRTMFAQIKPLRETGKLSHQSFMLFLEMMTRQVEILQAEFGERIHFEEVKTFHFNIRIVQATVVSQENKKEQ